MIIGVVYILCVVDISQQPKDWPHFPLFQYRVSVCLYEIIKTKWYKYWVVGREFFLRSSEDNSLRNFDFQILCCYWSKYSAKNELLSKKKSLPNHSRRL